ncbi:putative Hsp90 binding co-chaperone [Lipomyces tetrasporus]
MATTPEVLWAQRSSELEPEKNVIYLTVNAIDVESPDVTITPTTFSYKGTSASGKEYAVDLEFFDEIDIENSKKTITGRDAFFILRKKEAKEEFWPRLIKDKRKVHYIKTDFDKWVDEDEQETAPGDDYAGYGGGMDFSSLQNELGGAMGGMGGMGGAMGGMGGAMGGFGGAGDAPGPSSFDDDSDDDEGLPELVDEKEEEGAEEESKD